MSVILSERHRLQYKRTGLTSAGKSTSLTFVDYGLGHRLWRLNSININLDSLRRFLSSIIILDSFAPRPFVLFGFSRSSQTLQIFFLVFDTTFTREERIHGRECDGREEGAGVQGSSVLRDPLA